MATVATHQPGGHAHTPSELDYLADKGFKSWALTLDHKRIGIMYLVSVLIAFALGGLLALLIRLELFTPGRTLMSATQYNKVFSMHGIVMVFLFIIPSIPA